MSEKVSNIHTSLSQLIMPSRIVNKQAYVRVYQLRYSLIYESLDLKVVSWKISYCFSLSEYSIIFMEEATLGLQEAKVHFAEPECPTHLYQITIIITYLAHLFEYN